MENKIYIVIGNGSAKDTNKPYSRACAVKSVRGTEFQYVDIKDSMYLDSIKPVGHKFEVALTIK